MGREEKRSWVIVGLLSVSGMLDWLIPTGGKVTEVRGKRSWVIVGLLSVSGMLDWLIPTGDKVTEKMR